MRVHVKKKLYQMKVRERTIAGMGNTYQGAWTNSPGCTPGVAKNVQEGCMGAEPGVGRPRKGGRVRPKKLTGR